MITDSLAQQIGISEEQYQIWVELEMVQFSILLHCRKCDPIFFVISAAFHFASDAGIQCLWIVATTITVQFWLAQSVITTGVKHASRILHSMVLNTHAMDWKSWIILWRIKVGSDAQVKNTFLPTKFWSFIATGCQVPIYKYQGCNHMSVCLLFLQTIIANSFCTVHSMQYVSFLLLWKTTFWTLFLSDFCYGCGLERCACRGYWDVEEKFGGCSEGEG